LSAPTNKFYFYQASVGNNFVSSEDENVNHTRNYLVSSMKNTLNLRDILILSGANVVEDICYLPNEYIDLSPENLTKTSILEILL